jgi:hypothetical protein
MIVILLSLRASLRGDVKTGDHSGVHQHRASITITLAYALSDLS